MSLRDKLILWLAGSGYDETRTKEVLATREMLFELEQPVADAVGIMQALPWDARPKTAREQLEFIMCFEDA